MRKNRVLVSLGLIMLLLSGCYTTGLSTRESGHYNYSNFVYELYDDNGTSKQLVNKKMSFPVKLAVAQVGENSPQTLMLDELKKEQDLIARVNAIPALGQIHYYGSRSSDNQSGEIKEKVKKMCAFARDLGAEYLFLFGGSADYGSEPNFLSFFDITLIGAFVLPSTNHKAEGRASGALIDLKTEKVVFTASSEARISKITPSYFECGQSSEKVLPELRDTLVTRLTEDFLRKLREENSPGGAK